MAGHYRTMKVAEIRDELRKRGLRTAGLKAALEARLAAAIAAQSSREETATLQQPPARTIQSTPAGARRRRVRSRTPTRNRTRAPAPAPVPAPATAPDPAAPKDTSGDRGAAHTPSRARGRGRGRRRSRSPSAARVRLLPPGAGAGRAACDIHGARVTAARPDLLWRRVSIAGCHAALAGAARLARAAAAGVGGIAGCAASVLAVTPLVCALLALFVVLVSSLLPMVIDLDSSIDARANAAHGVGERGGSPRLPPSLSLLGLALAKLLHSALAALARTWLPHLSAVDVGGRIRQWVIPVLVRAAAAGTLVLALAALPRSLRALHQDIDRCQAVHFATPSWLCADWTVHELARAGLSFALLSAALPSAVAEMLLRTPGGAAPGVGSMGLTSAFVKGWAAEWGAAKSRRGAPLAAGLGGSRPASFGMLVACLLTLLVALQLSATVSSVTTPHAGCHAGVSSKAVLTWLRLPPGLSAYLDHLHATVQSSLKWQEQEQEQDGVVTWGDGFRIAALTSRVPLPTSPLLLIPPVLVVTTLLQDSFRVMLSLAVAFAASLRCVLFAVWCFLGAMGGASGTAGDGSHLKDVGDGSDVDDDFGHGGDEDAQAEADYRRLRQFADVAAARGTAAVRSVCASAPVLLIGAFWMMVALFAFAPVTSQHLGAANGANANASSNVIDSTDTPRSSALAIEAALATIGCGGHDALPRNTATLTKAMAVAEAAYIAAAAGSDVDAPYAAAAAAVAEVSRPGGASRVLQRLASAGTSRAALQAASPRIFGCARATLTIEPPPEPGPTEQTRRLRTGLFGARTAEEQTYDAVVRFSNAELRPNGLASGQPRRMLQIKVLNVRGERAKSPTIGAADGDFVEPVENNPGRAPPASPVPPVDFELVSGGGSAMEASLAAAVEAMKKVSMPAFEGAREAHEGIGMAAVVLAKIIRAASQHNGVSPQNVSAPLIDGIDEDLTRHLYTSPTTVAFAASAAGERPFLAELQARPCTSSTGSRRRRVRAHGATVGGKGALAAALATVDAETNLEDRLLHVLSEVDGDKTYGTDPPDVVATSSGEINVVTTLAGEAAPRWPLGGRRRRGRGAEARAPVGHWSRDQDSPEIYPAQGSGACFEIRGRDWAARSTSAVDDSLDDGWVRLATLRLHASQMRPQKRWQRQQHVCAELGFDVWRNALNAHRPVLPQAESVDADDSGVCRPLSRLFAAASRDRRELRAHAKRRLFRANGACARATTRAAERKQRLREASTGDVCRGGGAALGSCAELPELSEASEATLKAMRDVPQKLFEDGWGDFHGTAEAALAARDGDQHAASAAEWMIPPGARVCRARRGGWAPRSQLLRSTWHTQSIDGVLGEPYETETERQARIKSTASPNGVAKTKDTDGWRPGIEATYVPAALRPLERHCSAVKGDTGTGAGTRHGAMHPLVAALMCAEKTRTASVRLDLPHMPAWGPVSERIGAQDKTDSWQWHRRWGEAWNVAGTSTGTAMLSNLAYDVVRAHLNEDNDALGSEHNDIPAPDSDKDGGDSGLNVIAIGANAASALGRRLFRVVSGAGLGIAGVSSVRERDDAENVNLQFARRLLAAHTSQVQQHEVASSIDAFAALQVARNDPSGTHAPSPCPCSSSDCTGKAIATTVQLLSLPPLVQQALAVPLGSNTSCSEQLQSWPWQVGISAGTPLLVRWLCNAGSVRSVHTSALDPLLRVRPYDPVAGSRARLEHARNATDVAREKRALREALDIQVHADRLRWTGDAAQCQLKWYPGRAWGSPRVRSPTSALPWLHPHYPFSPLPGAEWNASSSRSRNPAAVVVDVSFDDGEDEWGVPLVPQTVHVLPKALDLAAFPAEPRNAQPLATSTSTSSPPNDWQALWQRLSRADKAAFRRTHRADLHFARQFVAGHNPFMITRVDPDEGMVGGRASEPEWSPFDGAESSGDWSRHIDDSEEAGSESDDADSDENNGSTAAKAAERFAGKWPLPARRGLPAPLLLALEALDYEGHHAHYTNSERERRDGTLGSGDQNSGTSDCSKLDGGLGGGSALQRLQAAAGGVDWRTLRREGRLFFADYSLLNAGSGIVGASNCGTDDVDVDAGADGADEDFDGAGAALLFGVWRVGGANRSNTVEFAHDASDTGGIKVYDLQPSVDEGGEQQQTEEGQHDNAADGQPTHESNKMGAGGENAGSGPGSWRNGASAHVERLPDDEQETAWWTRDGSEHVSHLLHLVGTGTSPKRTIKMRAAIHRATLAGGRRRLQLRWSDGSVWTRVGACGHGRGHRKTGKGAGGAGSDRLAPIVLLYLNGTGKQAARGACHGSAADRNEHSNAPADVMLKPLAIFAPLVSDRSSVAGDGTSAGRTYKARVLARALRAFFIAPPPPPGTAESAHAWASDEAVGNCRLDQPRALPGGNGAQRWGGGAAAWLVRRRLWRRRLWSWSMARAFASAADATLALAAADAGFVRLTAAPVALAFRRALPVRHPVRQLLEPHFVAVGDIDASAAAAAATVAPGTGPEGGASKAALLAFKAAQRSAAAVRRRAHAESAAMSWLINATALGASGALRLVARAHARRFRLARLALPVELASRGFGAPSAECDLASTVGSSVPMRFYPYRDDALLLWAATRRYVDAALRGAAGYPDGDRFVQRDTALRAFADELSAAPPRRHVGLRGVLPPITVSGLTDMVTTIIYHFTAGHAASRGAHFDAVALAPHRPLALRLSLPPRAAEWGLELQADAESARAEALDVQDTTRVDSNADFADDAAASALVRRALPSPRNALMVSGAARIVSAVPMRSLLVGTHECAQAVFGDASRCERGRDGVESEGSGSGDGAGTAGLRVSFDSLHAYAAFQRALAVAQREIERRNRARALRHGCGDMCTYHYLEPRRVSAAIDAYQ